MVLLLFQLVKLLLYNKFAPEHNTVGTINVNSNENTSVNPLSNQYTLLMTLNLDILSTPSNTIKTIVKHNQSMLIAYDKQHL